MILEDAAGSDFTVTDLQGKSHTFLGQTIKYKSLGLLYSQEQRWDCRFRKELMVSVFHLSATKSCLKKGYRDRGKLYSALPSPSQGWKKCRD